MKYLLMLYIFLETLGTSAQFTSNFNPWNYSYENTGYLTNGILYSLKDSNFAGKSFFKINTDTVLINSLSDAYSGRGGNPTSIVFANSGGMLFKAPVNYYTKTESDGRYATSASSGKVKVYDKSGLISSNGMHMTDTFVIASATPTISFATLMSSIGATNFKIKSATGFRVSATANNSPQVATTAITSNSVSFVVSQNNTAVVSILGINVLSGAPLIVVPDPQNVKIIIDAVFY